MDEFDTDTSIEELDNRLRTVFIAHSLLTGKNNEVNLLNKLKGLVTNIKWSPADVPELFAALLQRFESTTKDRSHLLSWLLEMLHFIEIHFITPSWKYQKGKTLMDLVRDETVTDEKLMKCLAHDEEKELDEILDEIRQQKLNQVDEQLLQNLRDIVSSVAADFRSHKDGSQRTGLKRELLKLCQAVEKTPFKHKKKITPRLTQMVSWCIMALSKTGRLIQVGTGEGKSCIVAMFAAHRAMRGQSVDILTSSSVLAERDLKEWQPFYQALNVSVDCNSNKRDKDQLKKVYECQVVYGTADKFAGDWLCQCFERVDVFGKRTFQCAILDEVDSLMLDKGHHVVYISSEMPALQHLNPLLAFIWATANQYSKIGTGTTVGQKHSFPHVVLKNITKDKDIDEFTILQMAEDTGVLSKGSVNELRKNLSLLTEKTASVSVNQLAEFFKTVERRFPSCQFVLHCMNNDDSVEELSKEPQREMDDRQRVQLLLTDGGFCQYINTERERMLSDAEAEIKCALHFTPCVVRKDRTVCYVPGFLSELVNSKLKVWIKNAFKAQTMTVGDEYVIEKHGIVPVDYSSTGVVQNFRILSDGLQQFLEMKHQLKLSDMTAITNYMSNVGLFLKYRNQIFGLSGTLGQQAETETLQKIYGDIKVCRIPLFKRRKLFEIEGVTVDSEKKWIEKICHVTANASQTPYRAQRAVLIICETINRAKTVNRALRDRFMSTKLYISNNMDNSEVSKVLQPGDVIVATNLAGRGTDLRVSDQVKEAGGLFVVLTFLSENARVEEQAFGRTARQGSPGSAQLIVCSSHLPEPLKLGKLQSLFESMTNLMQVYQNQFVEQFRDYHKCHRDDRSQSLLLTLSHILTKTSDSAVETAKKARDLFATQRLTSFSQWDIPNIKKKEELFSQYLKILDQVYKSSNNTPSESEVSALNEFWGMWLLTSFSEKKSIMDLKTKLTTDLKTAREKLKQRESPLSNLHHYTAFGKELCKKGHLAESIKMYTKAIQQDHCWAAIAYYNRAFTSLAQQDRHQPRNCIRQALEDLKNALKSVELYCDQIVVTHRYFKQPIKDLCCNSNLRFDSHIKTRQDVLSFFKANISEAITKVDRARELGVFVKVEKSLVRFMVPPVRFLDFAILSTQSLALIRSRDPLKIHQLNSHPFCDIIHELRSLETLGLTHVYALDTLFSLGGFLSKIITRACD